MLLRLGLASRMDSWGFFSTVSTVLWGCMNFVHQQVVEWFYMRHATRSLSKRIRLTFCDSYGLRVFPCSKITKIYLALICQCSIGPPKKTPPICGPLSQLLPEQGGAGASRCLSESWNKQKQHISWWWIQILRPRRIPCSFVAPISYYLLAVYIAYLSTASWTHLLPKQVSSLLQEYFVYLCKWRQIEMNQPKTMVQLYIHIYIYVGIHWYMDVLYTCIPNIRIYTYI